jgi:hypothetical protein
VEEEEDHPAILITGDGIALGDEEIAQNVFFEIVD